ncbi:hypothetical protein DXC51_22145 [Eisenbergiella massiliensis]|uniref:Uncharacterized protein n=1 Tax=Eisenbergiella massiliensis TaxID=1720294 RepID=A0A3E3HYE3_9FIRM|nr:hypothetical protein DXC51_22145 [Eisenbergiella massiliensis]
MRGSVFKIPCRKCYAVKCCAVRCYAVVCGERYVLQKRSANYFQQLRKTFKKNGAEKPSAGRSPVRRLFLSGGNPSNG